MSRADRWLLILPGALLATGLILVFSSSSILALSQHDDAYYYVWRQMIRALLGGVALIFLARLDYHRLGRVAAVLFAAVIGLLLLTSLLGVVSRGSVRTLSLIGFGFHSGEIARVVTVIFLSWFLVQREDRLASLTRGYLPALAIIAVASVFIALEPNLSSAAVLFVTGGALLYFAGARYRHLAATAAVGALGFLAMISRYEYQRERLTTHIRYLMTGELEALGSGWQLDQALIALGSGGLWGRGLGQGLQKFHFLPDPHTDFILAIAGEEGGLLITAGLLTAFVLLFWRGYRVALRAPDRFGSLLAAGITTQLAIYTFVNMGVATGLLPTTGLPLPFISYGGSALVMNLAAMGILISISAQAEGAVPERPRRRTPVRRPGAIRKPAWEALR